MPQDFFFFLFGGKRIGLYGCNRVQKDEFTKKPSIRSNESLKPPTFATRKKRSKIQSFNSDCFRFGICFLLF